MTKDSYYNDGIEVDPIEYTKKYKEVEDSVLKEAEENLLKEGLKSDVMGYCHSLWPEMKKIFKEKHNIDWKTPIEMNPYTTFD